MQLFQNKGIKTVYLVFGILFFTLCVNGRVVESPCSNLFLYKNDGSKYYGTLTLRNIQIGQYYDVHMWFETQGNLPKSDTGNLDFLENNVTTLKNIRQHKPIVFKVTFPVNGRIPQLTKIVVNNNTLCTGSPDIQHQITTTNLSINFETPKDVVDNLNSPELSISKPFASYNNVLDDICGLESLSPYVFGGQPTERGDWPWLVAIFATHHPPELSFQCGGNLISTRTVLTAAHCLKLNGTTYSPSEILISIGHYNILRWNEDGAMRTGAQNIFIHPDYHDDLRTFDADIAVVLLKDAVSFSQYIKPICLWTESSEISLIEGLNGTVVGWGKNEQGVVQSPVPKEVSARIVSESTCRGSNVGFVRVTSNRTFCAGNRDGTGPCSGDSGGGLVIYRDGRWVIRGTVSGSLKTTGTCNLGEYVIYSDTAKFLQWIYSVIVF